MDIEIDPRRIRQLSIDLLSELIDIFDKYRVDIWLDQGTLLGAIRSNDFLPWDDDIDLGVWKADLKARPQIWDELRKAGFLVFFLPRIQTIRVERKATAIGWRSLDIQCYDSVGDQAVKYFQKPTRWVLRKGLNKIIQVFDMIGEAKNGPDLRYKNIQTYIADVAFNQSVTQIRVETVRSRRSWVWKKGTSVLGYLLPNRLLSYTKHVLIQLRLLLCVQVIRLDTPSQFFRSLEQVRFLGVRIRTPSPVLEYLRFKYGDDWRTPRRDWVYYQHDGAIAK